MEVALSKLKGYEKPKVKLEQYMTDCRVAADLLWTAYMAGDVEDRQIADFGAGTGILGLGALLLGARRVFLVESESSAMELAKKNHEWIKSVWAIPGEAVFQEMRVEEFNVKVDIVVENPPFGTKSKHADKGFLEQAMKIANKVYSFHKSTSEGFVQALADDKGFAIKGIKQYRYPLKATFGFHKKHIKEIEIGLWILEKVSS